MLRNRIRKGFTVVELSIGVGIFLLVLAGFVALYFGQQRSAEKLGQKTDLADQARVAWFRMTEEVRTGIDLLHPIVGSSAAPYLLFTNDKYELTAYWVEKFTLKERPGQEFRKLMRLNFNAKDGRKAEVVAPFVERVQFTRKGPQLVDVLFGFKDADNNSLVLTVGITVRNAVSVN